jgi:hypothetical protein
MATILDINATEFAQLLLEEFSPSWMLQAANAIVMGSARNRPIQIVGTNVMYTGIKYPYYGSGWGPSGGNATLGAVVTALEPEDNGEGMLGEFEIVEVWYRELTGERSLAGAKISGDLGTTPKKLSISSNAVAPATERYISHREFYINYTETIGSYYLLAHIPYTGATDTIDANIGTEDITKQRPLEDARQTGIFPALRKCAFWRSRLNGAGLERREGRSGSVVELTDGSKIAVLKGDTWREDDVYKGIVDYDTNEIVAYIERVLTDTQAVLTFPNPIEQETQEGDRKIYRWGLSADETSIFCSSIYIGEQANGLSLGHFSWSPLDIIENDAMPFAGSSIRGLFRVGEDLIVVYDRAVIAIQGEVSVGIPDVRTYIIGENVGSFHPDASWADARGTLWFQGQGRIYMVSGGEVADVTEAIHAVMFYEENVGVTLRELQDQQVSYNPELNAALIVGVSKPGEPGPIDELTLVESGSGYRSAPSVVISGDGSGATATATIIVADPEYALGTIQAGALTSGGAGYPGTGFLSVEWFDEEWNHLDDISYSGSVIVDGGVVTGVIGFGSDPSLLTRYYRIYEDDVDYGAYGDASCNRYKVNSIALTAAGSGYTSATVAFTGGGQIDGATAVATATVEGEALPKTYAVMICHDENPTIHPQRFPVPIHSITCEPHSDGQFQWYAGSDHRRIYKLMGRGVSTDTYYDSEDVLHSSQPIVGRYRSGIDRFLGDTKTLAIQIICESSDEDLQIDFDVDAKQENILSRDYAPDMETQELDIESLNLQRCPLPRIMGRAFQYRWVVTSTQPFCMIESIIVMEQNEPRVFRGRA